MLQTTDYINAPEINYANEWFWNKESLNVNLPRVLGSVDREGFQQLNISQVQSFSTYVI